jgi:Fe-S-cluster containining protein
MADDRLEGAAAIRSAELVAFLTGLDAREQLLLAAERRAATAHLSAHARPERILQAAQGALSFAAAQRKHQLEVLQPEPATACREGCHWCCYLKVSVTVPEVLLLAQHLQQHTSRDALAQIVRRAAELAQDPRIFSADAKAEAKLPCALLTEAGACAAYEARPLACRGWNSTDAESCRRWLDDDSEPPLANERQAREQAVVSLGLLLATTDAGLPEEVLELTSALDIALREPDALARWLAGEGLFQAARADGRNSD